MKRLTFSTSDVVDLVAVLVLTMLAAFGFRASFDGSDYLVVAGSAAVLGTAAAWLSHRLGSRFITVVAVLLVVFVLAGQGLATRGRAIGGVVPTPDALSGLVDGVVHGWGRLLTSLPRSGTEDNVLAVPYVGGFLAAMSATLLALKVRRVPLCVLPPVVLLVVTVLLGSTKPASILVQGVALGVVALAWMSYRHQRSAPNIGEALGRRMVKAVALLGAAAAVGGFAGPHLPFAQAQDRYTLREHITPPLDLSGRPSPLGSFRAWLGPDRVDQTQLVLDNWPKGARVRLAAMDSYDGLVWNLAGSTPGTSGVYERVGTTLPTRYAGDPVTVTVRPGPQLAPFVPTLGDVRSITPQGQNASTLVSGLRVSRGTDTALQTKQTSDEGTYRIEAVLPRPVTTEQKGALAYDPLADLPPVLPLGNEEKAKLDADIATATTPYARVEALTALFRKGYFSDGGYKSNVAPGHSLLRIAPIVNAPETAKGDSEQYAAAMALAARSLGMPARVVLGFAPEGEDHVEVKGSDIAAWVEVAFDQVGWVRFDPTPDKNRTDPLVQKPEPRKEKIRPQVPALVQPKVTANIADAERDDKNATTPKAKVKRTYPLVVQVAFTAGKVAGGGLLLASPLIAIAAWKARRRRKRRTVGAPAQRIAAGWSEVLDLARDTGQPLPAKATRREVAVVLGTDQATDLADSADRATFAADLPAEHEVGAFWQGVEHVRASLLAPLTRVQRLRAAVSLKSVRTSP